MTDINDPLNPVERQIEGELLKEKFEKLSAKEILGGFNPDIELISVKKVIEIIEEEIAFYEKSTDAYSSNTYRYDIANAKIAALTFLLDKIKEIK